MSFGIKIRKADAYFSQYLRKKEVIVARNADGNIERARGTSALAISGAGEMRM